MIRGVPYDAEVEFLESTGTQWIDTGVLANGEFDAEYTISTPSTLRNFIVGGARSSTQHLNFGQYEAGGNFVLAYLENYWISPYISNPNTLYTTKVHYASGSQTATVNGVSAQSRQYTGTEALGRTIYLFKRNFYGASDTILPMTGKMHSFKIWQNGVLVRDYIPVRVDTTGYLYDRVSKKLFGNLGTGDFVLGPDKAVPVISLHRYVSESGGIALGKMGVGATLLKQGKTARDYVQNGLVAMWDGIDGYDSATGHFFDIESGTEVVNSKISRVTNAMNYTGVGRVDLLPVTSIPEFFTAEACVKVNEATPINGTNRVEMLYAYNYSFLLWYSNAWCSNPANNYLGYADAQFTSPFAVSFQINGNSTSASFPRSSYMYYNGREARQPTSPARNIGGTTTLAAVGRNTSSQIDMDIFNIRLYSRALTADEIAHNYAIDRERFNLP